MIGWAIPRDKYRGDREVYRVAFRYQTAPQHPPMVAMAGFGSVRADLLRFIDSEADLAAMVLQGYRMSSEGGDGWDTSSILRRIRGWIEEEIKDDK